jgi:hypothetical protein
MYALVRYLKEVIEQQNMQVVVREVKWMFDTYEVIDLDEGVLQNNEVRSFDVREMLLNDVETKMEGMASELLNVAMLHKNEEKGQI